MKDNASAVILPGRLNAAHPPGIHRHIVALRQAVLPLAMAVTMLVPASVLAGTHTWTGASGGRWSNPINWIGGAPQAGEAAPVKIIIPSSVPGFRELTNDIPGLIVQELTIAAHANILHAAPGIVLRLQDATLAGLGTSTILEDSFRLELEGVNHLQGGSDFVLRGAITEAAAGAALRVSGSVRLETSSRHSGFTHLSDGVIYLLGAMTNTAFIEIATNAEVTLAADFTTLTNRGRLNITPEALERPQTSRLFGQGFVCLPGSTNSVMMIDYPALDSEDPADGGRLHSRLMINGPVVLAGRLEAATDLFQAGLRFSIIQNIGSAATKGQFDEMPEGALMFLGTAGPLTQRIGYRGESGKDVTLTSVLPPAGQRLAGPWRLGNGSLQILGGIAELEDFQPHRWEANTNLGAATGWIPILDTFIPATDGTILTITNAAAFPQRFFRLTRQ